MESKPQDILYCNIDRSKIINANPKLNEENLKIFYNWLVERYTIHIKREVLKLSFPWTKDKILSRYKFTNVRREHDRETKCLINNIVNSKLSYNNKLLNIILFRLINKSETIELFGLIDFNKIDYKAIKGNLDNFKLKNSSYVYFSNAFFTSGPKTMANKLFLNETEMVVKMIKLVEYYLALNIVKKIKNANSQLEVFRVLKSMPGIGDFLAYQIFVDFSYLAEFPFSENEFVIAGPGCKKGLQCLFKDFDGLSYGEALFWLRDNQTKLLGKFGYNPEKLFSDLPKEDRMLNIMSLENCMCELSKYIRALTGEGRPRILYKQ